MNPTRQRQHADSERAFTLAMLATFVVVLLAWACGGGEAAREQVPSPALTPGYPGAATYSAPPGATNFLQLGADPTGATSCLSILKSWYDGGGRTLYVPAGSYKFSFTLATATGVTLGSGADVLIVGAGEGVTTFTFDPPSGWGVAQPDRWGISLFTLEGPCALTLRGIHFAGSAMPSGGIWYEQVNQSIVFADSVVSTSPTTVVGDHVTWENTIAAWYFFAGATTPTKLILTNFSGGDRHQNIAFFRGDQNYHRLLLTQGSFTRWGIAAADNPVTGAAVGHAVYCQAQENVRMEGVYWENSLVGHQGFSLKLGGSGNVTAVPGYQILTDCKWDTNAGGLQLDGLVRAIVYRCVMTNVTNGMINQWGQSGVDCVDCSFNTQEIQFGANTTSNFTNCSFLKGSLTAYKANTVVNIMGGTTHWVASAVATSYILKGQTVASVEFHVWDHDFWSEITDQSGQSSYIYGGAGTWTFTRCTFRGTHRTGVGDALIQIPNAGGLLGSLTFTSCTFGISTAYAAKLDGGNGHNTLITTGTTWASAQVSDSTPSEWSNTP